MAEPITKIVEICRISPTSGSVPPTHLPLTFFDLPWFSCFPMPLFVFELPLPTDLFTATVIPKLKHSLSLSLRHFFPLAAVLACPPPPLKPHLLFSPGDSSVSFTVAESDADFNSLLSNEPQPATDSHPFIPKLPPPSYVGADTRALPLLALQVTVFPNSGFTVGATFNHVAADGRAFLHFMKSWSLLCRSYPSQELTSVDLPLHDRDVVVDPHGIEPVFLKHWWAVASSNQIDTDRGHAIPENTVRATFVMGRAQIEKLKQLVSAQLKEDQDPSTLHVSSFIVTIACTWTNLIKSQQEARPGDETCHLSFTADCRSRSISDPPIPAAYFGNCLATCFVSMTRNEIIGENGILRACEAIGKAVREMNKEPLRGAKTWVSDFMEKWESGNVVTVAGSANMGLYSIDFGWGKPKKSLSVHIDVSGAISVAECMEEGGGMEIGLALNEDQMKAFTTSFQQSLLELM